MTRELPLLRMLRAQHLADVDARHSTLLLAGTVGDLRTHRARRVGHQIAQHREEVRHRLTSARFATLNTADRDTRLGLRSGLLHKLDKPSTAQTRRPPQVHGGVDRDLDVVRAERQRGTAHGSLNLGLKARRSLCLPTTHLPNDTPERGAEPLPQTPTQRPAGARLS